MNKTNGGILITVLVIFMIISLMITLLFSTIVYIQRRAMHQIHEIDARLISEAGIDEAMFKLNSGQMIYYEYEELFSNGKFEIKFSEFENTFTIESIGTVLRGKNHVAFHHAKVKGLIKNNKYIISEYEKL
ncbi:MAG: hypothetical protein PHV06_03310 [bacterium]|nr:hypothetical protein [bacterium]